MAIICVTGAGGIVRQTLPAGGLFPGHSPDDSAPTIVNGVIEHTPEVLSANEHVSEAIVNVKGTTYVIGELLTVVGGTFVTAAVLEVLTLGVGDRVETVKIVEVGDYSVAPTSPVATTSSASGINATFDLVFTPLGTGGFLNLAQFLDRNIIGSADKALVVFWIKVVVGPTVTWNLYVTSGRGGGLGNEVDDVCCDALATSGTGSVSKQISLELAPDESLRLITGQIDAPQGIFQVHFMPAKDTYGRPMN